jgi:glycosyltransferase involved in cell wall biosynthesis
VSAGTPTPELTVVIPTKDRPSMLPRAGASVLGQVSDVEVVVVDDGSTPENARTIRDWCSGDGRIRLLRNEHSRGAPQGRNRGLAVARGRYWATLDDDDQWLPGKWDAQRAILAKSGFPEDLVVVMAVREAGVSRVDPALVPRVREPERPRTLTSLLQRVPSAAFLNTYVVPTPLIRAIGGYDDRLVWGEHTDVLIRLWKVAVFAGASGFGVVVDRRHGGRVGRDWVRKIDGIRLLLEKHAEDFDREPAVKALYLHVLGVSQLRAGDRWGAARTFAHLLRHGPGMDRRARASGHLAVTAVGGRPLWRAIARLGGAPLETPT